MIQPINPEAKKQDSRPFYKKKRFIIPVAFFLLCGIIAQFDDKKEATAAKKEDSTAVATSEKSPSGGMDLKTKIQNNIKSIDGGDDLTKGEMNDATSFSIAGAIFKAYAASIKEGKASTDPEVVKLTTELETKVKASQKKNFPKLREAYYKFIKNKLWENDVYVDQSGANKTTLRLTGHFFASNKNIKSSQEALQDMLTLLRFKKTEYCWYKGQSDVQYYDIESASDDEIID